MSTAATIAIAAGVALAASVAAAEPVGSICAVNPSARGTAPGAAARALTLGASVVDRERVETDRAGSAQIAFRDRSTLTVGRNSQVTIDRFVFSGNSGGEQAISAAKGVLRFVGGGVSHGGGASIHTPAATIAVRGGTVLVDLGRPKCGTLIVDQFGALTIRTKSGSRVLARAGAGVCISPSGEIGEAFRVSAEIISGLQKEMASELAQHGGVDVPPTEEDAERLLGGDRPLLGSADSDRGPGLDTLNMFWAGQSLARSRAEGVHQPAPAPATPHVAEPPPPPPPSEGGGIGGGAGGFGVTAAAAD
ncbi:FecR domain-containing protein [Methylosinus sp. Sm6]|uniref:FecR family protein n=1 Tax=Methylosinus sp. Sm6 TaxID=2866948 RepID=UPI001C99AD17|nr:FecR domain-containing protein [Methylosinus sp. Sm6]MBY6242106.1 FecR domain-containing protein [Methylosinus sp. Sm6]